MAEHVFESPVVEEFYNSCHSRDSGRFCGAGAKGKSVRRVPMSAAARSSNAVLRGMSAARKTKEYKTAKTNSRGTWANRERGQKAAPKKAKSNTRKDPLVNWKKVKLDRINAKNQREMKTGSKFK